MLLLLLLLLLPLLLLLGRYYLDTASDLPRLVCVMYHKRGFAPSVVSRSVAKSAAVGCKRQEREREREAPKQTDGKHQHTVHVQYVHGNK
ncbi:hypothetical protein F4859DRAFT_362861 [Xylaria cf. heliscus]|nr:hypothetical protein F4859DRAFT_362861 [Xylaria cf. heliscus]